MSDEIYLRDERIYIVTCRLAELRIVAGILRNCHVSSADERDRAAVNTAATKIQGVILRSEKELERILKTKQKAPPAVKLEAE